MGLEEQLKLVADRYLAQGYQVVVRPEAEQLPPFAKDFRVEILATRADGNVLATAKETLSELRADRDVSRYADATQQHKGWRFDLFILGPEEPTVINKDVVKEPSDQEIRQSLEDASKMLSAGFVSQSLISAWAALEAAMRRRLRAHGSKNEWRTSPRTMLNELFSAGDFDTGVFRELERMFQLRAMVVHGFTGENVEPSAVHFVIGVARSLLESPLTTKKTA